MGATRHAKSPSIWSTDRVWMRHIHCTDTDEYCARKEGKKKKPTVTAAVCGVWCRGHTRLSSTNYTSTSFHRRRLSLERANLARAPSLGSVTNWIKQASIRKIHRRTNPPPLFNGDGSASGINMNQDGCCRQLTLSTAGTPPVRQCGPATVRSIEHFMTIVRGLFRREKGKLASLQSRGCPSALSRKRFGC